jgi:hypothetical protein
MGLTYSMIQVSPIQVSPIRVSPIQEATKLRNIGDTKMRFRAQVCKMADCRAPA